MVIPARYRASLAYLLRHPWQLGLALLGASVGVAVIVAVDLANSSARKAFLLSMDTVAGAATHQIIGGPAGVAESVYTALRVEHGLEAIAPIVEGEVDIGERRVRLLGVDLFAEQALRNYAARGAPGGDAARGDVFRDFLIEPGAVLLPAPTAAKLGVEPGAAFAVEVLGEPHTATLLETFGDADGSVGDLLLTDIATAQEWLGNGGYLSRIDVRLEPADANALANFEALLPAGTRVLSAAGRSQATVDLSRGFMTNLTAMSLLALLVGLFLILNSVSFSVLQRRTLFGTLRALGLTRREVLGMILVEAGAIGLVAALLGIALGILLGEQLLVLVARSINDLYFRVSVTDVQVDAVSVVKGLAAGLGAALLAAAIPAVEATGYRPRLAMARSALESRARHALPYVTLAGLVIIAVATVVILASGRNLVAGLTAVFLLILGFSLCVPILVRTAAGLLAPLAGRLGGSPARLAVAGVGAGLSRTGVAVVALAVAVSATIGVTVMVDSFRGSVVAWLDQSLQADLYANAGGRALDPGLIRAVRRLDGVAAVSTSRRTWLEEAEGRTQLIVIEMAPGGYAGTELLDAEPGAVWPAWSETDAVLVSEPYAYRHDTRAGDSIRLPTDAGRVPFTVAATFRSYDVNASAIMMSRQTYARHYADSRIDSVSLYLEAGTPAQAIEERLAAMTTGGAPLDVYSNEGIREASLEVFDQTFVITDVLYWLAMGVAFIGILSAMLALQLERSRELATLRALGMTPLQVGSMLTVQTGLLGLLSGLAALPLGIVMAWVLIVVINRRAFGWQIGMDVDPAIVGASVSFAVVAALLAGLYPAWRAAHLSPALAMREE